MQILNQALRHATDGFIGILDMFGFEDSKPSQLEQLCINLSSETMQHFYNTHIFKSSIESCREEGIASDVVIDYIDNVPCIDLISSLVSFFKFTTAFDLNKYLKHIKWPISLHTCTHISELPSTMKYTEVQELLVR